MTTTQIAIHLPARKLRAALECAANKKAQFKKRLQCVNIETAAGKAHIKTYITATDGHILYSGTCTPIVEHAAQTPPAINLSIPAETVKAALKAAGGKAKNLALHIAADNTHTLDGLQFTPSEFGSFPDWRRPVMQFDKDAPAAPGQYDPDLLKRCQAAIEHATGYGGFLHQRGNNAALLIGNVSTDFCIIMPRAPGITPAPFVMPAPAGNT